MLEKVMRHEWRETYKVNGILLIIITAVTLLGVIMLQAPIFFEGHGRERVTMLDVMSVMSLIFYFLTVAAVFCGSVIYLGINFYRSMYTDRGYLTHTLPVSAHELFGGKLLVACIWHLIFRVAVFGSIVILGLSGLSFLGGVFGDYGLALDIWRGIMEEFFRAYTVEEAFMLAGSLLIPVITAAVRLFVLYGAITIGQLFNKYKVLMSILSFVGINMGLKFLAGLFTVPFLVGEMLEETLLTQPISVSVGSVVELLVYVAAAAALYVFSIHIIQRRLNLE